MYRAIPFANGFAYRANRKIGTCRGKQAMADDARMEDAEEATEPSMDSAQGTADEESEEVVNKLHEQIDNLNLVLDHLERKNGDIYSRIGQLLTSFQRNNAKEEEDDEDEDDQ